MQNTVKKHLDQRMFFLLIYFLNIVSMKSKKWIVKWFEQLKNVSKKNDCSQE